VSDSGIQNSWDSPFTSEHAPYVPAVFTARPAPKSTSIAHCKYQESGEDCKYTILLFFCLIVLSSTRIGQEELVVLPIYADSFLCERYTRICSQSRKDDAGIEFLGKAGRGTGNAEETDSVDNIGNNPFFGHQTASNLTSTSLRIAPPVCELHGFSRVKIDNLSMFHGCHCNDRIVFTDLDMEY